LSFNENVEFSMIPGASRNLPHHVIKGEKYSDFNILKTGVIYGANASGKSNLIKAIAFSRKFITQSLKPNQTIPIRAFKLKNSDKKVTKIEFEFKYKKKFFAYGFTLDSEKVHDEWLYKINKKNEKLIFERKTVRNADIEVTFGIDFKHKENKKRLMYIAKDALPNQLFLTVCNERNVKNIKEVTPILEAYHWFDDILTIIFPESKYISLEFEITDNEELTYLISKYLKHFDTGINGIELVELDFEKDIHDIPNEIKNEIKNEILKNLEPGEKALISVPTALSYALHKCKNDKILAYKLMTKHKRRDEKEDILFDIQEESDGTQRLMDLIPALIKLSKEGGVYLVDELDRSLHPKISREFIRLFLENTKNTNSQLIVTTHESSLLDLKQLRKDEIWFVTKNEYGESSIYSLEEFKPRYDKEIRRGYLQGRFGAVPLIDELDEIIFNGN